MNTDTATPTQVNRIAAVQLAAELLDTDSSAELINLADYLIGEGIFAVDDLPAVAAMLTAPRTSREARNFRVTDGDGDTLKVDKPFGYEDGAAYVSVGNGASGTTYGAFVPRESIDALIATLTNLRNDYDERTIA